MKSFYWVSLAVSLGAVNSFQLPCRQPLVSSTTPKRARTSNLQTTSSITALQAVPDSTNSRSTGNDDNLSKFSTDIKQVLQSLRADDFDPCIPSHLIGRPSSLSYSKTWTLEDWEYHNSRKRYLRYLWYMPRSRLVRRIMPQQLALLAWAFVSLWVEDNVLSSYRPKVPLSGLGTLSTFVAFLLTLRSNQ